jgi:hypothetical protein
LLFRTPFYADPYFRRLLDDDVPNLQPLPRISEDRVETAPIKNKPSGGL